MYELETKVTGLTSRNAELESLNAGLNKRLAELIQEMEAESKRHRSELARKVCYGCDDKRFLIGKPSYPH